MKKYSTFQARALTAGTMNLAHFETLRARKRNTTLNSALKKINQLPSRSSRAAFVTKMNIPRTLLSRENFHLTCKQQ